MSRDFESKPLSGKRIALTRTAEQNAVLAADVERLGGTAVSFPCLQIEAIPESIEIGLDMVDDYSDVLFTSANGVHAVAELALAQGDNPAELFSRKRVAAVGKQTAAALAEYGVAVDLVPKQASQDGLIETYREFGWPRHGLLFFRAEMGRESLIRALNDRKVRLALVPAYRSRCPHGDTAEMREMLAAGEIDAVLLGSSKVAINYLARVGSAELANRPLLVAISDQVAAAAAGNGLNVQLVTESASFQAMLDALVARFSNASAS